MCSASSASMPCKLIACSSFVCLAPCCISLEKRSKLHFNDSIMLNRPACPRSMELHSSLLQLLQGTFLPLGPWGPLLASRDSPEANAAFPFFSVKKSWKISITLHIVPFVQLLGCRLSPILTRTSWDLNLLCRFNWWILFATWCWMLFQNSVEPSCALLWYRSKKLRFELKRGVKKSS